MEGRIKKKINSLNNVLKKVNYNKFIKSKKIMKIMKGGVNPAAKANNSAKAKATTNNKKMISVSDELCKLTAMLRSMSDIEKTLKSVNIPEVGKIGNMTIEQLLGNIAKIPNINNSTFKNYNQATMKRMYNSYRAMLKYVVIFIKYMVSSYEVQVSTMGILKMQEASMKQIKSNVGSLKASNTLQKKINNMEQQLKSLSVDIKGIINNKNKVPNSSKMNSIINKLTNVLSAMENK